MCTTIPVLFLRAAVVTSLNEIWMGSFTSLWLFYLTQSDDVLEGNRDGNLRSLDSLGGGHILRDLNENSLGTRFRRILYGNQLCHTVLCELAMNYAQAGTSDI